MDATRPLTRRSALRLAGGAVLAAVPALRLAGQASAGRSWCRVDPSFWVDGLVGNVLVSGDVDRTYDTTGPIQLTFTVPEGTNVQLLASDDDFGQCYAIVHAWTEKLRNDHKKIEVEVEVVVPAVTDKLPVRVEFVPDGTVEVADRKDGTTNKRIKVKTQLKKPKRPKGDEGDPGSDDGSGGEGA
jgi:hypothetical protein